MMIEEESNFSQLNSDALLLDERRPNIRLPERGTAEKGKVQMREEIDIEKWRQKMAVGSFMAHIPNITPMVRKLYAADINLREDLEGLSRDKFLDIVGKRTSPKQLKRVFDYFEEEGIKLE